MTARPVDDTPLRNDRGGAVVVEMALILPLFLTVLWGIIEFGRAMMVCHLMSTAARSGARAAILDGSTNAVVIAGVRDFLVRTVGGIQEADVTVTIEITPAAGHADPNGQLSAARTFDLCRVNCSIPYQRVGYIGGSFLSGATLRGTCSMPHE